MNKLLTCFAALALSSTTGCEEKSPQMPETVDGAGAGLDRFYLSKNELAVESGKAMDGDAVAADRVYMHYSTFEMGNTDTIEYWMHVAVDNGSAGYMIEYAKDLHKRGSDFGCRRALFWLDRAVNTDPGVTSDAQRIIDAIKGDERCTKQ